MTTISPLRYPGGKIKLYDFFKKLIESNNLVGCTYAEPFAGGASLAFSLLESNLASKIYLNDLDPAIYTFWWNVLHRPNELIRLVNEVELNMDSWCQQKAIFKRSYHDVGSLELAFSTLFLNRTNHSGILNAGVIGGKSQAGTYKLDARFNRKALSERIMLIAQLAPKVTLSNKDATQFIQATDSEPNVLFYLDPPYFGAGARLYLNFYTTEDHERLKSQIMSLENHWVASYDDHREIREIWNGVKSRRLTMPHTARNYRVGKELVFFSDNLKIPRGFLGAMVGATGGKRRG